MALVAVDVSKAVVVQVNTTSFPLQFEDIKDVLLLPSGSFLPFKPVSFSGLMFVYRTQVAREVGG
jgi:hypothetical protein